MAVSMRLGLPQSLPNEGGTMCKRVLTLTMPSSLEGWAVCAVLPTGCLPAAGGVTHSCAGEASCAGRRGCHRGDCARYPCMPLVPLALASPGGGHPPPPHMFQGSSSPGHPICSACCDHKSMLTWSCRYWHPLFAGLLTAPSMQTGGPCCRAVPAGWGDIPVFQRHGLRVLPRDPHSFTPLLEDRNPPRSLLLGHDMAQTQQQIAQFSQKDAQVPLETCTWHSKTHEGPPCPWSGRDAPGWGIHCTHHGAVLAVHPLSPSRPTLSMRRSWGAWCWPLTHCWMPLQWIQLPWERVPCSSSSGACEP